MRDVRVKYTHSFHIEQEIGLEYIKRIRAAYSFIRSDDTIFSESQQNIDEAAKLLNNSNSAINDSKCLK